MEKFVGKDTVRSSPGRQDDLERKNVQHGQIILQCLILALRLLTHVISGNMVSLYNRRCVIMLNGQNPGLSTRSVRVLAASLGRRWLPQALARVA